MESYFSRVLGGRPDEDGRPRPPCAVRDADERLPLVASLARDVVVPQRLPLGMRNQLLTTLNPIGWWFNWLATSLIWFNCGLFLWHRDKFKASGVVFDEARRMLVVVARSSSAAAAAWRSVVVAMVLENTSRGSDCASGGGRGRVARERLRRLVCFASARLLSLSLSHCRESAPRRVTMAAARRAA